MQIHTVLLFGCDDVRPCVAVAFRSMPSPIVLQLLLLPAKVQLVPAKSKDIDGTENAQVGKDLGLGVRPPIRRPLSRSRPARPQKSGSIRRLHAVTCLALARPGRVSLCCVRFQTCRPLPKCKAQHTLMAQETQLQIYKIKIYDK
jgi:hypothetical protein